MTQTITVIRGDGIGPEIMDATLYVLDAMKLGLQYEDADAGMVALEKHGELLPQATMDSIRRNKRRAEEPADHAGRRRLLARSTSSCASASTCTPTCARRNRSRTPSRASRPAST